MRGVQAHAGRLVCTRVNTYRHADRCPIHRYVHTHINSPSASFLFLSYLHSHKASQGVWEGQREKSEGLTFTEAISAKLRRSVKGQAFPSPGCVNHINTLPATLTLRSRLQPPSGAHAAGATLSLLLTTLYCCNTVFRHGNAARPLTAQSCKISNSLTLHGCRNGQGDIFPKQHKPHLQTL